MKTCISGLRWRTIAAFQYVGHIVLLLLTASVLAAQPSAAEPQPVHMYAAASLQPVLDELTAEFRRTTDIRVVSVYGASGALARQIAQGAPADIYVSANVAWMDYLQREGRIAGDTRRDLVANRLLAVQSRCANLPAGLSLSELLSGDRVTRIAIGNPATVPAGTYARQALTHLGLWDQTASRAVYAENVRAALAWVDRCEADLGFVYVSDALASETLGIRVAAPVPPETHDPIRYPLAVIAGQAGPEVRRFLEYISSNSAMHRFEAYGFAAPD